MRSIGRNERTLNMQLHSSGQIKSYRGECLASMDDLKGVMTLFLRLKFHVAKLSPHALVGVGLTSASSDPFIKT